MKAKDPYGNVTSYVYDEDGNLKELTKEQVYQMITGYI